MAAVERQPGCLVSLLWFVFIGCWASLLWSLVAWLLIALVIPMPLGLAMLNRLPRVATLRAPGQTLEVVVSQEGSIQLRVTDVPQRPFWLRALWFVLVGWWFSPHLDRSCVATQYYNYRNSTGYVDVQSCPGYSHAASILEAH